MLRDMGGVTESHEDLLARELVFRLELLDRRSGSESPKKRRDVDPGSRKARLPETNSRVH